MRTSFDGPKQVRHPSYSEHPQSASLFCHMELLVSCWKEKFDFHKRSHAFYNSLCVRFAQEHLSEDTGDVNADVAADELQDSFEPAQVVLQELGGPE